MTHQPSAINFAAVCNTLDLRSYGYKMILSRISKDLEGLEEPFKVITDEDAKTVITGVQFSFVADNAEY